MIISSWNINSVRIRTEIIKNYLVKEKIDILLLQEIKCQHNEFPSLYKEKNYNLVINGEKGKYGVAILIKKKIEFEEINFESNIFKCEARICGIKIKNDLKAILEMVNSLKEIDTDKILPLHNPLEETSRVFEDAVNSDNEKSLFLENSKFK